MRSFTLLALLLSCLLVGGCADLAALQRLHHDAALAATSLRSQADALDQRLAALPPDDPSLHSAQLASAAARTLADAAELAAAESGRLLTDVNPHPLAQILEWTVPFLPEPYRAPVVLAGAAGLALLRAARLKAGLASIAHSIQKALESDPAFAQQFRLHADTLRSIQTPLARKVVDQATSGRSFLPV